MRSATGMGQHFGGIARVADTPPGALGADSRAILGDYGHDEGEIDALIESGAVRIAGATV